jgi:hypothetical protein
LIFLGPWAAEAKCLVSAHQLETVARKIQWLGIDGEEDNGALIRADGTGDLSQGGTSTVLDYEVFIRPETDGVFQVLPVPLFVVRLEKAHDIIYVCAHLDSDHPSNTEILVYFLRDRKIKPISPMPLPLTEIKNLFWGPLRHTPLAVIGVPVSVGAKLQEVLVHIFSDVTRIGVDRVRVTSKELQLFSGGDPGQFDRAVVKKIIPLKPQ